MPASNPKIGFVSLGCPKALVDSERILTQLKAEGYEIVPRYDKANAVIVNTCGFIDAAVQEALPKPHDPFVDLVPDTGIKLTPKHYAYLKISEGCNHRCTFCIIPSM